MANSGSVWVSVNPATVNAGSQTQVTASCGEDVSSATVSSTAFGSKDLRPTDGVLAATVTVVPNTAAGTYGVRLACPTGNQATTTLTVIGGGGKGKSVPGPDTGGGFLAGQADSGDQAAGDEAAGDEASRPADRTPVVWLGAGLAFLLAGAAVAVRNRHKVTVRSTPSPSRGDQGNAEPQ